MENPSGSTIQTSFFFEFSLENKSKESLLPICRDSIFNNIAGTNINIYCGVRNSSYHHICSNSQFNIKLAQNGLLNIECLGNNSCSNSQFNIIYLSSDTKTNIECLNDWQMASYSCYNTTFDAFTYNINEQQSNKIKNQQFNLLCSQWQPTLQPTTNPTVSTFVPTESPTFSPSTAPTFSPVANPTAVPSIAPTGSPTVLPTSAPTMIPTISTKEPSKIPTSIPSKHPSFSPTLHYSTTTSHFVQHFVSNGNQKICVPDVATHLWFGFLKGITNCSLSVFI